VGGVALEGDASVCLEKPGVRPVKLMCTYLSLLMILLQCETTHRMHALNTQHRRRLGVLSRFATKDVLLSIAR
jgi:hypothetical protein